MVNFATLIVRTSFHQNSPISEKATHVVREDINLHKMFIILEELL